MAKILVAEDEPDIQQLIILTLQHAGYEVVTADDGEAAYRLALDVSPDLILMDVKMPKLNGYQACKMIKAEPTLKHVPVVFLSVRGAQHEVQQGLAAGAVDYLVKPFAPQDLAQRVTKILAEHPAP